MSKQQGAIAWMAKDKVTPNLLMLFLMIGGLFASWNIKKEIMLPFEADIVNITVSYSGSTPEEVDLGIVLPIENAISGLDGIDQINSTAYSGSARIRVEVLEGTEPDDLLQAVDQEVSRLTNLPEEADKPSVSLQSRRMNVMEVMFYGDVDERVLRTITEISRDRLLLDSGLTQIDLKSAPEHEIHVELNPDQLRRYGLTVDEVSKRIKTQALDQSSGKLETTGGDIYVRVQERRDQVNEFRNIPIKSLPGGTTLLLKDLARVQRAFEDSPREFRYNGKPAQAITIFRVGNQSPMSVSDAALAILPEIEAGLPPGVSMEITEDDSEIFRDRVDLLLKNAFIGLALVLILLSLFLEYRLAFWVTMGIPTSFLGAMLLLPELGVSINMISMFAFIIALGIVVDDAIIAGENIYHRRQQGMGFIDAAITGAKDVAVPLTFSILTNMVAFLPLLTLPGMIGKLQQATPLVVISVFAISWIEALFILPAHLGQMKEKPSSRFGLWMNKTQSHIDQRLQHFINHYYQPSLIKAIRYRYVTLSIATGILLITMAWQSSGRLGFYMFPRVDADSISVIAKLTDGSSDTELRSVLAVIEGGAKDIIEKYGGDTLVEGYESRFGDAEVRVTLYLTPPDIRPVNTETLATLWRESNGMLSGLESINYSTVGHGPGGRAALTLELAHSNSQTLQAASDYLADQLTYFAGISDISTSFARGRSQLDVQISGEGLALGLTANDISSQLRSNLLGATALKQQEGRNELSVRVRLKEQYRHSESDLFNMMIRTASGDYIPLSKVANISNSISPSYVSRRDGRRTADVTAEMNPRGETPKVIAALQATVIPQLKNDIPGLEVRLGGSQRSINETTASLIKSCTLALLLIYMLLAIPFQSFVQPLLVMAAIPFGLVGAYMGHILLGYTLSMISMLGIVALSGVVVNDSLMLINTYNVYTKRGMDWYSALIKAGCRRFRPIILTTMTTFGGLAPMIFETSRQAQFITPMAVSLGFGILFATIITLAIVPCLCAVVEDIRKWLSGKAETGHGMAS